MPSEPTTPTGDPAPTNPTPPPSTEPSKGDPPSRYYLVLFQSGASDDPFGDLNRVFLQYVHVLLAEKIREPAEAVEIDVWLESPGGSASVAYKLFLELQSKCHKLRIVVPDFAKSAATLLTIGGDEIYMGPAAELGPLDAQIEHPDREGVTVSALEVAGAFDFLGKFAVDYAVSGGGKILKWTELPRSDVLREFLRFSARFLEPAVAKLDPHLVYRATNQLDLAHQYAMILLRNRRLSDEDEELDLDAKKVSDHLVRDFPAHEFLISLKKAEDLKLPVRPGVQYPLWAGVQEYHNRFRHGLIFGQAGSIVELFDEEEIEERFAENDAEGPADEPTAKEDHHENGHDSSGASGTPEAEPSPGQSLPENRRAPHLKESRVPDEVEFLRNLTIAPLGSDPDFATPRSRPRGGPGRSLDFPPFRGVSISTTPARRPIRSPGFLFVTRAWERQPRHPREQMPTCRARTLARCPTRSASAD